MNRVSAVLVAVLLGLTVLAVGARPLARAAGPPTRVTASFMAVRAQARATVLFANSIVYDATRDVVYASVPGSQGALGNSIVTFDRDGVIRDPVFVGSNPNVLALSADDRYLYVGLDGAGALRRVIVETMTADGPLWSLGSDPLLGVRRAHDLVVLADNPHAVAVARKAGGWPGHGGVAVYEDGVMRPVTSDPSTLNMVIEPSADPAQLFGYYTETSASSISTLAVDGDGVNISAVYPSRLSTYSYDFLYAHGRLFSASGDVVDAASVTPRGRFAVENNSMPAVQDGRALFVVWNEYQRRYELQLFDIVTFAFLAAAPINGLDNPSHRPDSFQVISAGPRSLAVLTAEGEIYWLRYQLFEQAVYLPAVTRGLWEPGAR